MPGSAMHNRNRIIPFPGRRGSPRLVVCSVCLRVHVDGAWMEADDLIRRLRTFELGDVVRLGGALCEPCETELRVRRHSDSEALAA